MTDRIQARLLRWAAAFLVIYCMTLTLAPSTRAASWSADFRFTHWAALLAWIALVAAAARTIQRYLPDRDPFIFPAAALLSGWGLLTVWRLDAGFGLKQTAWFVFSIVVLIFIVRGRFVFRALRRYKYVLLLSGLVLTALTLIAGTNPLGAGPRLWLGCCGIYFQPSEPLKLLLVIYLASYFADRPPTRLTSLPVLMPAIALTGIALLLLLVQRDLGTASIFILIFALSLYVASGKKRTLVAAGLLLIAALLLGYFFTDTIPIRIDGWLHPWDDPTGRSYQIVQSLLAIANGGTLGRGPGLGSPSLVPVSISDFVFSAVGEETGLVGTLGMIALYWLILGRGILAALRAPDRFKRYLAAGIVAYLGVQSILIIGGNVRLLPLTGVTLPFVSYGGSSLLTAFIAVALLIKISSPEESEPVTLTDPRPYTIVTVALAASFAACALALGWWTVVRASDLLSRTDNARRAIADRYVPRGDILDRNNEPIDMTVRVNGFYQRSYAYPLLAPVIGYTDPVFGQAGIESSLDGYLRGLQGNAASLISWDHLLYGTPPPGLDLRVSIDLSVQRSADEELGDHRGGIVVINARSGEILAMASHPAFDPNDLAQVGSTLLHDPSAPLLNRAAQGLYPLGSILMPLVSGAIDASPPTDEQVQALYEKLGLYSAPIIPLPALTDHTSVLPRSLLASPLQVAIAASTLSNHGLRPAPRIAMAVNSPDQGWLVLPAQSQPVMAIPAGAADATSASLVVAKEPYWQLTSRSRLKNQSVTWIISGTVSNWGGTPVVLVVLIEENNLPRAREIAKSMMLDLIGQKK